MTTKGKSRTSFKVMALGTSTTFQYLALYMHTCVAETGPMGQFLSKENMKLSRGWECREYIPGKSLGISMSKMLTNIVSIVASLKKRYSILVLEIMTIRKGGGNEDSRL